MAGNYPDALGARIAYDRLNCTLLRVNSPTDITAYTGAQMALMNGELGTSSLGDAGMMALVFPVPYTLTHIYLFTGNNPSVTVKVSTDTTNGYDGTWTTARAGMDYKSASSNVITPSYRTQYALTGAVGVKAVRLDPSGGTVYNVLHVFGYPTSYTDRLEMWHPTLDQPLRDTPALLDYGDVPRGTTPTKQFRVKNLSASLTAGSVTVGAEALTDSPSPTIVSQTQFSIGGGSYASTASISSLAPGAISGIITSRLNTNTTTTALGLWAQRYYAQAASWS